MRTLWLLAAFGVVSLAVAGCSTTPPPGDSTTPQGSDSGSGGGSSSAVTPTPAATPTPTPGTTSSSQPPSVSLTDNRYDPLTLGVKAFTKVTFTNHGTVSHTVTIVKEGDPSGSFVLDQALQPNSSNHHTFSNAGTYQVWCRYHEDSGMEMTITVT